jgi:hypothetical protein
MLYNTVYCNHLSLHYTFMLATTSCHLYYYIYFYNYHFIHIFPTELSLYVHKYLGKI